MRGAHLASSVMGAADQAHGDKETLPRAAESSNLIAEVDALKALFSTGLSMVDALRAELVSTTAAQPYLDQQSLAQLEFYKVTPRAYLENARAGAFEHEKIGRQVRTRVDIFEAWLASKRRQSVPRLAIVADEGDARSDIASYLAARRGAR